VDAGLSAKIWDANPGMRERSRERVPVRRLIEPSEIAKQVAFLCGAGAVNITGTTLLADGGLSLMRPSGA
jgi:NAD(P)-dependent dehydrogenase (short-subunit alcohol dehydrogenase family)